MAMEPWNPWRDMMTLRDAMDRLFQESFVRPTSALLGRGATTGAVPLDIRETDDGYEVDATLPGVRPEDVQITVEGDTLTIRGETRNEQERKDQNYITRERHSGSFYRSVTLPAPINADQAQASFEHGILHLTLPKAEQARPKQIRISGAQTSAGQQLPSGSGATDTAVPISGSSTGAGATTSAGGTTGATQMGTSNSGLAGPGSDVSAPETTQQQPT